MAEPRILYLSYDGVLEPVGHSQILPYLRGLAPLGAAITLISFEKHADTRAPGQVQTLKAELLAQGIRWIPLSFHKHPMLLAKSFDLLVGLVRAGTIVRRDRVQIVHARSYVPALMAWLLKRLVSVRFIFDMRGFWAEERAEDRLWRSDGFLYRLIKRLERRLLSDADEVVMLTERARLAVERWPGIGTPRVTVIPTCVDLKRFSGAARSRPSNPSPVLIYAGSVGSWYLLEEMLGFYVQARQRYPDARFELLTRNQVEASEVLTRWGLGPPEVTCTAVPSDEIPGWLARAHLGLAFYRPGPARHATCPMKIGEYLAMGLPVMVNDAVGDVEEFIGTNRVGVVLSEFSTEAYSQALDQLEKLWADPTLASRCRQVAESCFSLQSGVARYWAIYQRLA